MPEIQHHNSLVVGDAVETWAQLRDSPEAGLLRNTLGDLGQPVAILVNSNRQALLGCLVIVEGRFDGLMLSRERLSDGVRAVLGARGYIIFDMETGRFERLSDPLPPVHGRISLLTSGTTGSPKLVSHRWNTLFTAGPKEKGKPRRWLVPYQIGTYAWFQLVTLGLFQKGQTLVFSESTELETLFKIAAEHRVDSLSATPTFWRLALMRLPSGLLDSVPLENIALGGELADQSILTALAKQYPSAQISHIYASSEAGTCVVVKDGLAGFPSSLLNRDQPDTPSLTVRDGHLWIRSPFSTQAADGYSEAWIDSGDLVEVRGERVHFLGRADKALINVGGNKAYPADIERVLLGHPSIQWCRVRAVRSPLVGYLPEADIVIGPESKVPDETELTAFCSGQLPSYAVPRFWNILDEIPVTSSLKSAL